MEADGRSRKMRESVLGVPNWHSKPQNWYAKMKNMQRFLPSEHAACRYSDAQGLFHRLSPIRPVIYRLIDQLNPRVREKLFHRHA